MKTPTPEEIEEAQANAWKDYLYHKSAIELGSILFFAICKLMDNRNEVQCLDYDKLIELIRELDYTGEFDVSGFEDIRSNI